MKTKKLTVPLMDKGEHGNRNLNGTCVAGRSRELLLEIKSLLEVFAPSGDDHRHGLWIEVPRGKPEDWCSFRDAKCYYNEDIKTREDYSDEWEKWNPQESQWYYLSTTRYKGKTYLHIVQNDHWWCLLHDDDEKTAHVEDWSWYLEPLAAFLRKKVPAIAKDVTAYNRYVDEHLPKRQRTGRIARKDLDRIVPWQRRRPRNYRKVIRMLKECIANEKIYERLNKGEKVEIVPPFYREPLPHMSIRIYAKYFRVAYGAYKEHFRPLRRRSRQERGEYAAWQEEVAGLTDIEFYRRFQFGRHGEITDETDFDSEQAFKDMAFDHYGELGLSRNDVHATDYYTPGGWLITFGVSYSAWVDAGCEIALALYEAGAPLLVYDAQKMLDVLEGKDYVKLTPHTFHDYLNHHKEGSVFALPYECYLDRDDELTRAQYNEIVSLAEWDKEDQLELDTVVPLEDSIYDLIRDEVKEPLTLCGILERLEDKYDIVLGVSNYSDHQHCYVFEHSPDEIRIEENEKEFETVNDAMYYLLGRYVEEKKHVKQNKYGSLH